MPGVAIPFYLAHPRLARLEFAQMLEVEGGTPEWCMRILRHEAGHALDNAYGLRRRRRRQQLFGLSSKPYPEYYTPRPYSRSFVLHLEPWYAQSHPDEDFAETFAVWLTPDSPWRTRYAGLAGAEEARVRRRADARDRPAPAARDHAPHGRAARAPAQDAARALPGRSASATASTTRTSTTATCAACSPTRPSTRGNPIGGAVHPPRPQGGARRAVAQWTGEYQYTIDQVIDEIAKRCRELDLRARRSRAEAKLDFTIFLAVQTMHYLHSGRHRVWL